MSTVTEHYENHLAEYYSWMFGDFKGRVEANRIFFEKNSIVPRKSGTAVDLGAGPGYQSLALARLGFRVLAVDLSQKLLNELKSKTGPLPIAAVRDDMLNIAAHCPDPVEVCVCMGDTLTHLDSFDKVMTLFQRVYDVLEPGGRFVMTFRDLTSELTGLDRFIPVRSDAQTIFTCFLEYEPEHVLVNDLVYTRNNDAWLLKKSVYQKLRLPLSQTLDWLKKTGFILTSNAVDKGMIAIVAEKRV